MLDGHLRRGLILSALLVMTLSIAQVQAAPAANEPQQALAPTYRIFATREGLVGRKTANGHVIQPRDRFVALPSWAVLSPKGANNFQVRLTYNGRTVVVPVWDVGPWNTKDDYWNPNRRYSDLPVGRPMAEAAYFDGYNGGRDEFGRKITNPNGIDIADGTFWDDLGMTRNDWVLVTFLWLGADPGPGNAVPVSTPSAPAQPAKPVEVEAGATTVDNGGAGYTSSGEHWDTAACGLNGNHAWTLSTNNPAKATSGASWAPELPAAGFYELKVYIPECGIAATSSARYTVHHDGAVTAVPVDQQANAGSWVSLGIFHFGGDTNDRPMVELDDLTADSGRAVRFDVMAWAPRTDTAAPDGKVVSIKRQETGYLVTWGGTDDMSGIASYDLQVRRLPSGGWTDWKQGIAETSAWFGPDEGKHFAFRIRARDWAGNQEPWPEQADMDTTQATP